MNKNEKLEAIRYAFLLDWLRQATEDEILEKLIQNDERGKLINKIKSYLDQSDLKNMLWGKEILKIIGDKKWKLEIMLELHGVIYAK